VGCVQGLGLKVLDRFEVERNGVSYFVIPVYGSVVQVLGCVATVANGNAASRGAPGALGPRAEARGRGQTPHPYI